MVYGIILGFLSFLSAVFLGFIQGKLVATFSLIGTSIVLEAQPAAVASLPLHFHPFSGAVISILGNLVVVPVFSFTIEEIINRWKWIRKKLQKTERWSHTFEKYGAWALIPLSPVLGAYVCIGVGHLLRWKRRRVLTNVLIGMVVSTFAITYGGHSIFMLLTSWLKWF
ncbi:small multi-drug export protein [Alicyclobacillus sp. SO9]|nr:small multi-drug export protein [Alicyclobacillus sp. SO9]